MYVKRRRTFLSVLFCLVVACSGSGLASGAGFGVGGRGWGLGLGLEFCVGVRGFAGVGGFAGLFCLFLWLFCFVLIFLVDKCCRVLEWKNKTKYWHETIPIHTIPPIHPCYTYLHTRYAPVVRERLAQGR